MSSQPRPPITKKTGENFRPNALLKDLNQFLSIRLKELDGDYEDGSAFSFARLEVYREAFQEFISHFHTYRYFLGDVKREYDSAIEELCRQIKSTSLLRTQLSVLESKHKTEISQIEAAHLSRLEEVCEERNRMEVRLTEKDKELRRKVEELAQLQKDSNRARNEHDDLRKSLMTLTNSLIRLEEERKKLTANDARKSAEVTSLNIVAQKSLEDVERLRENIADLETIQASLVQPEVLEKHLDTIESLHAEIAQKDANHKLLIARYNALKTCIEHCRKRTASPDKSVSETVSLDIPKRFANDPAFVQIQDFAAKGGDSRNIIEMLLDRVCNLLSDATSQTSSNGRRTTMFRPIASEASEFAEERTGSKHVRIAEDGETNVFSTPWSHFQGLGFSKDVPPYLRHSGKVQNMCLSKRETAAILEELWAERAAWKKEQKRKEEEEKEAKKKKSARLAALNDDPLLESLVSMLGEEEGALEGFSALAMAEPRSEPQQPTSVEEEPFVPTDRPKFADFFDYFLQKKYVSRIKVVEMAYNILDAVGKYSSTVSDFKLFSCVLNDELPEEIYQDQQDTILMIKTELTKDLQMRNGGGVLEAKKMSPESILRCVKRILSTKPEASFARLTKVLSVESKNAREVDIDELLSEKENGLKGKFCDMLCQQHLSECLFFSQRVLTCIEQFREPGEATMSLGRIREAIMFADNNKSRADVNKYLERGMGGVDVEVMLLAEANMVPMEVEAFSRRLRRHGLLKKSPRIHNIMA